MLAHVRGPLCLGKPDEAIDVLRTGVASNPKNKLDEAALLLAWSDAEAARGGLGAALERAERARDALEEAAAEQGGRERSSSTLALYLRLLVQDARLRASLALVAPPPSAAAAEADAAAGGSGGGGGGGGETLEVEKENAVAAASAAGMRALSAHSRGDAEAARREAETVVAALGRLEEERESGAEEEHPAAAAALASLAASRAAAVRLAGGEGREAEELYSKGVALAERARKGKGGGSGADKLDLLFSPLAAADAALAALCGRAQARAFSALPLLPPEDSQKDAGDALSCFDAEEGDLCLRRPEAAAGPLLLVLGSICAGSGQVMVAEGLFRRGGQVLGISSSSTSSSSGSKAPFRHSVHPSVASALAWRHAQLLTALPQRGREAAELAEAAARIEETARATTSDSSRSSLEDSLGTLDALTGRGRKGRGVVVDAAARRVLPWLR